MLTLLCHLIKIRLLPSKTEELWERKRVKKLRMHVPKVVTAITDIGLPLTGSVQQISKLAQNNTNKETSKSCDNPK